MTEGRINIVTMPKWGLAMQEGTITEWYRAEGDQITEGEPICDIETTKITNEFEAPFSGTIARVLAPVGSIVEVGDAIAVIVDGSVDAGEIERVLNERKSEAEGSGDAPDGSAVRLVGLDDGQLAVLETGPADNETAVVFLHGFGGDHENWGLLQAQVPATIRTVAVDLPGHGRSDRGVGDGSPGALARRVAPLLDALGIRHALLVAHSFGAAVALQLAAQRPEQVSSLFLIAPVALGARAAPEFVSGFMSAQRKRDMKPVLEMLFSDPGMLGRTMVTDALALLRDEASRQALSKVADHLVAANAAESGLEDGILDRYPTVIVWGDADAVVQMPAALPASLGERLKIVPHAGHMPHAERPDEVARQLLVQIA